MSSHHNCSTPQDTGPVINGLTIGSWEWIPAVGIRESFEDGLASRIELSNATDTARRSRDSATFTLGLAPGENDDVPAAPAWTMATVVAAEDWRSYGSASNAVDIAAFCILNDGSCEGHIDEYEKHCNLLGCISGKPFKPTTLNPQWLTSTVMSLATSIYEQRVLDLMPVLPDALEEAAR
jgi:hypothetical protein